MRGKRVVPTAAMVLMLTLSGCGGDDDGDADQQVAQLDDAAAESLCEAFHDDVCQGQTEDFCAPACRDTCRAAGTADLVRSECIAPITVGQVHECAELYGAEDDRAFEVCTMGGGCVFDVFDQTCF